ncbi:hypothetical protein [Cyanobium sp. Morenito 9A2]|uniref:hypothetical protein n=1 Tax=Cyanobium sp. Morenito 9A2 TaxID=2823718 RepID=UPI0020CFC42A|nr:hypothetical protein [Cyanobium sp. Morenito 9A2]MCP9848761.1 hypothetical protein [Cyanobium sp. Morenito 9A2]
MDDPKRHLRLAHSGQPSRDVYRKRKRPPTRLKQFGLGLLLAAVGAGLLVALLQLPERLDTVLLVSKAIGHLISGLTLLGSGLLQLLAVLVLVALALTALTLLVSGLVRIARALWPRRKAQSSR